MSWGITAVCRTLAVQKTRSVHLLHRQNQKVGHSRYSAARPGLSHSAGTPAAASGHQPSLSESFRTRMLYSCLVDADYLDTEQFMQGDMPRGAGAWIEIAAGGFPRRFSESLPSRERGLKFPPREWSYAVHDVALFAERRRSLHSHPSVQHRPISIPSQSFTRPTKTFAHVMTHVL